MRSDPAACALLRRWAQGGDTAATTEVNFFEVAVGIERERGPSSRERIALSWHEILRAIEVMPLTRRATLEAVRRQAQLYRAGTPAPFPDLLVAAIGKVGGCSTIVTRNTRDFARIGLLHVEAH